MVMLFFIGIVTARADLITRVAGDENGQVVRGPGVDSEKSQRSESGLGEHVKDGLRRNHIGSLAHCPRDNTKR